MVSKCSGITKAGKPCRGTPVHGSQFCMTHHPDLQDRQAENRRQGGEARSNARRAVKAWSAFGREMDSDSLPAILRSCMVAVRDGAMLPNEANAIAALARTSMQIEGDLQLEQRIVELERAAGLVPATHLRRVI